MSMWMAKRAARICIPAVLLAFLTPGCRSPSDYTGQADRVAYKIIDEAQRQVLGKTEHFTIATPADTLRRRLLLDQNLLRFGPASLGAGEVKPIKQWPDEDYLNTQDHEDDAVTPGGTNGVLQITLVDALQIGARNSREYQTQKEQVFQTALQLDLERDAFRNTWQGTIDSLFSAETGATVTIDDKGNTDQRSVSGLENNGSLDLSRRFQNGVSFTALLGLDLVKLLTQDKLTNRGVFADATISIPLMRGSGRFVVTEPLTQAQRDVVYAIYDFERFKKVFAVRVARDYLAVLQQIDQVINAEENYRGLISSTRRAARLAEAGRLPEIQVDQARQNELRARDRWVSARASYTRRLDAFKVSLGLPTDARIELDESELDRLTATAEELLGDMAGKDQDEKVPPADAPIELVAPSYENAGPLELAEADAIRLALERRLDLRVVVGRILDSQRTVAVAADQLRADLTLLGSGSAGARRTLASVAADDADIRLDNVQYSALLSLDLPLERTRERNLYRNSLIAFEQAVRNAQALEDQIKLEIRNVLSDLLESRESIRIQAESVAVAQRRVDSTNLFLEAGRAAIRDVLEAQESLVSAQNLLTAALINYRVGELDLQRDLGVLEVNEQGLWQEYTP